MHSSNPTPHGRYGINSSSTRAFADTSPGWSMGIDNTDSNNNDGGHRSSNRNGMQQSIHSLSSSKSSSFISQSQHSQHSHHSHQDKPHSHSQSSSPGHNKNSSTNVNSNRMYEYVIHPPPEQIMEVNHITTTHPGTPSHSNDRQTHHKQIQSNNNTNTNTNTSKSRSYRTYTNPQQHQQILYTLTHTHMHPHYSNNHTYKTQQLYKYPINSHTHSYNTAFHTPALDDIHQPIRQQQRQCLQQQYAQRNGHAHRQADNHGRNIIHNLQRINHQHYKQLAIVLFIIFIIVALLSPRDLRTVIGAACDLGVLAVGLAIGAVDLLFQFIL